jgi:hypothetical protein
VSEPERPDPDHAPPSEEDDLGELDFVDPLKRDPDDESLPGLDPIVPPVPPES